MIKKTIISTLFFAITFLQQLSAQLVAFEPNLSGKYEITAAARGSNSSTYNITLRKPAGATTAYKIYLYNAGTGYNSSYPSTNYMLSSTIRVDGTNYTFPISARQQTSSTFGGVTLQFFGYSGEVSGAIKTKMDAAVAGNDISFTINEGTSSQNRGTDGVGIIVVWNNPTKPIGSHFVYMGMELIRSAPNGTVVNVPVSPIDKTIPGFEPILGIGINYSTGELSGAQGTQRSRITINGNTLTDNAGGYDDGSFADGSLITLGGYGDNPISNDEDELYNINSLLNNGTENLQFVFRDLDSQNDDIVNAIYFSGVGVTPEPCNIEPPVTETPISNICPSTTVNLNTQGHLGTIPGNANTQLQWYTTSTRDPNTQVTTPTTVGAGTYYAFYYNSDNGGCYSPPSQPVIVNINTGPDSDGDVIPDMCDLDADNDGILNTNECYGEKITNGSFTGNANGWSLAGSWAYNNNSVNNSADNITNEKLSQTLAPLSTQAYKLSFNLGVRDYSSNSSYTGSLTIRLGGVIYAVINNGTGNSNNITMTLHNGATSTFVPFSSPTAPLLINYKDITIDIPYIYSPSQNNEVSFSMTANGDDFFIDDVSLIGGCDTDGDGIPDYFDLDSDNDGCLDAIEGDGGFTTSDLVTAGGTVSVGTSTASNQNLGNTIDANGVPTIVAGGQGKGSSADATVNACIGPCTGPNSDGDVIPDMCDLDADNDGILNTNECYGEKITNGSFTGNANGWTLAGSWAYNNNSVNNFADNITNEKLSQTLAPLSTQTYKLSFNLGVRDYSGMSTYTGSLTIRLGGVIYAVINNGTGNSNNITMTLQNGATSTFVPFSSPTAPLLINYKDITIDIPYIYSPSQNNEVSFSMTANGDDFFIDDVSLIGGCDTDGDGIPDYFDLDSDNDGCLDAIEGNGVFTTADLVASGGTVSVGTSTASNQNLGNTVGSTGIPTVAGTGQGVGSSQNAMVNPCAKPDIVVNKIGPISAQAGSTISYNVVVTNHGPNNAANVIVKDPAVANFTVTGITCTAGAGIGGAAACPSSVTIAGLQGASGLTIPSLPEGSGVTFTITGTVGNTAGGAIITNTATIEYADDTNIANNSSTVNTSIYQCLTEESVYTVDSEATKALASNVINPNGGVINMVYKLTSGPAVPGIGNEFTQTVTYSDLNNNFGIDNQWEGLDVATFGTSKLFVLSPKTSAGTGRLYNSLPVNNSTNETLMASNNRGDNIFTSKIEDGSLNELGRFTISIGNFPAAPAGYVSTAGSFRVYANGNTSYLPDAATATANSSGFWLKPLIQTGIRNDGSEGVLPIYMMAGNTYEWRYSAFSNGTNFATNYFGTATTARGVLFYHTNSITFAKAPMDCACYKPGLLDPTKELPTKVGITSLSRAGSTDTDNWPMVRKGGHIALESQTKGFVPNRVAFSGGNPVGIPVADFVEGMMVYDTTNKCMKVYTLKEGDASMAWHCVTTQTCPD